jgi:uncharacterized protein (UPF0333 family)
MNRFLGFVRKERLYLLLFTFILVVNAIVMIPPAGKAGRRAVSAQAKAGGAAVSAKAAAEEKRAAAAATDAARRAEVEKVFAENRYLALVFSLTTLLIVALDRKSVV